jgi:tRNA pseudouridine55 synthase
MSEAWDGLLPIDKPAGPTSHDLVARVRWATGAARVGHTGTLDPGATGLLLLLLGHATRLARFVPDAPKTYRGVLALGVATTSDDLSGDVVRRHQGPLPSADVIRAVAASRLGRQMQVPPAFSARHVGGTRLYRLARRGVRRLPKSTLGGLTSRPPRPRIGGIMRSSSRRERMSGRPYAIWARRWVAAPPSRL